MVTERVSPATMHSTSFITTQSDNQVRQVDRNLAMIYPKRTPFLAISNQLTTSYPGKARKLEWGNQADPPRCVIIEGTTAANGVAVGAAIATLFVSPAGAVVAHETLLDPRSNEVFYVISNTSGALIVGTRGAYNASDVTCTPLALPVGTALKIIGAAKEENAEHSNPKGIQPEMFYNVFQTFEEVVAQSTLARAIEYYLLQGGSLESNGAIIALEALKLKMENSCIFGSRLDGTSSGPNSGYLGMLGGLMEWNRRQNNVHDVGGAFTYSTFMDIMSEHARVGNGGQYYMFGAGRIGNICRKWALDYSQSGNFIQGQKTEFGLRFNKIVGDGWDVNIVPHESFEEDDVYATQALIVKGDNNSRHFMSGLGLTTNPGIESPKNTGKHGYIDQLTCTMTLKVKIPEANCTLTNITS